MTNFYFICFDIKSNDFFVSKKKSKKLEGDPWSVLQKGFKNEVGLYLQPGLLNFVDKQSDEIRKTFR